MLLLICAMAPDTAFSHENENYHKGWNGGSENEPGYEYDEDTRGYGWDYDHGHSWNHRKDKNFDRNKKFDHSSENFWRRAFDVHIPRNLKGTHQRLPLLIVVDSKGTYRGKPSRIFYQQKAAREGFILAYALQKGPYIYSNRRDDDLLVRTVLNMLDGYYRVDTRHINVRYD